MVRHAKQIPTIPGLPDAEKREDTKPSFPTTKKGTGKYHDEHPRDRSTRREKLVRLERAWHTWQSWLARRNGRILQLVSIFSYGVPRGVGESFFLFLEI